MDSNRIGFVDLKLDNGHANTFLKALREDLRPRGFVLGGCYALDEANGRAWAEANHVRYCDDAEELNGAVDCFMVLAPSNPEVHLDLCRRVLPYGKPTYVDKTFAPSLRIAEEIYDLADRHGAAIQTSSALRYTNVQAYARDVGPDNILHMVAWGGGRSFDEYVIHPVELAEGSKPDSPGRVRCCAWARAQFQSHLRPRNVLSPGRTLNHQRATKSPQRLSKSTCIRRRWRWAPTNHHDGETRRIGVVTGRRGRVG